MSKKEDSLNLKIVILPSNKIRYAYLQSNYFAPNVGNLGVSCMRYKEMQKALNFYVKNNIRIVVVTDDNKKIHARALLWDNVRSTRLKNPFTYLDRIYAKSDELLYLFHDLATTNKWKRYPTTSVNDMDTSYYKEDIDAIGMCHLPYNDTFRYLHLKNNLLTSGMGSATVNLFNLHASYVTLSVHNNRAYYPRLDPDRVREAISGNYISKKDAIKVKRYDGYVLKTNIADIDGAYYSVLDNLVIKAADDKYILKENSVTEVFTNDVIDKSKAIQSPKYKGYIHKSNIVCIKDEIYHKSDDSVICFKNKWYHISECFINYNREEINKELAEGLFCSPEDILPYWVRSAAWDTNKNGSGVVRKGSSIPKEHAIIAYDLVCVGMSIEKCAESFANGNPKFNKAKFLKTCDKDKILYQERYFTGRADFIKLNTGEFIVDTSSNRKYLKKFNNKYYIKQDFEAPSKKQLQFDFGSIQ